MKTVMRAEPFVNARSSCNQTRWAYFNEEKLFIQFVVKLPTTIKGYEGLHL